MFVLFGNIVRKSLAKETSTCTAPLLFLIAYSVAHMLEKYLNLEGFLEKSLKNKSALKSTGKSLKVFEFYNLQEDSTVFWRPKSLSKCGAFLVQHMLHQIKAPPFYTNFLKRISLVMGSSISEVEF